MRTALWGPLLIAAALAGAYIYMHDPFARDGTELLQVPLSEEDPSLDRVGDLKYLGGLDIPRMGQNIGGLSGLRWDSKSGRLLAITDDARWVWLTLSEENDALTGIENIEVGDLVGLKGEVLTGKEAGDSESLTRHSEGGWLVGFERNHRVWHYQTLAGPPEPTRIEPEGLLGPMEANRGLEAMATIEDTWTGCAESREGTQTGNCILSGGPDIDRSFVVGTTPAVREVGAVPTDADYGSDGALFVLLRNYSSDEGNIVGIQKVEFSPTDYSERELAVLETPLTVDNFEGLAVREEGERTFLYIVSDDNFSGSQRTLLMKFELLAQD